MTNPVSFHTGLQSVEKSSIRSALYDCVGKFADHHPGRGLQNQGKLSCVTQRVVNADTLV